MLCNSTILWGGVFLLKCVQRWVVTPQPHEFVPLVHQVSFEIHTYVTGSYISSRCAGDHQAVVTGLNNNIAAPRFRVEIN